MHIIPASQVLARRAISIDRANAGACFCEVVSCHLLADFGHGLALADQNIRLPQFGNDLDPGVRLLHELLLSVKDTVYPLPSYEGLIKFRGAGHNGSGWWRDTARPYFTTSRDTPLREAATSENELV